MLRRLLYAVVAVGVFACSPADVSAPAPDQPDVADTRSTPPRDVFGFNDSAGMWAEPEPDAGWFNPMGRGGGWGMLPRLGGAHCGPAGQWSGHIPNPKHPTVPGVVVTATADCPSDPFPSDDVVMDWLRRVNAQRREWASGGWSPFAPGASPTAEEAQYCRARIGQAPSPEEFAETVEWAELACPPCFEALVLAFGAWESWQTAGAIVEVGQRLLREGMPCGREAVIMALGALSTITRGVTGPVGNAVWNRIAPNGALIGTRFGRTDKNRDLAGGLAAAEALFAEIEALMGVTRVPLASVPGAWSLASPDGTTVNFRPSSSSGPAAIGFNIPGKPAVKFKFPVP